MRALVLATYSSVALVVGAYGCSDNGNDSDAGDASQVEASSDVAQKPDVLEASADAPVTDAEASTGPILIADQQENPSGIAVDGTNVYWANYGGLQSNQITGTISKAPIGGGSPVVLATSLAHPYGVVATATNVLFTTDTAVAAVPIAGGSAVTLADNLGRPFQLATDNTSIYFSALGDGAIYKVPVGGIGDAATPQVLSSNQLQPKGLAIDSTNVYWVNFLGGTIMSVPTSGVPDGGSPLVVASNQAHPYSITIAAGNAYWTLANQTSADLVVSTSIAGDAGVVIIAANQANPEGIATDSNFVYWCDNTNGNIMKGSLDGKTAPVLLATSPNGGSCQSVAVDATRVYWGAPKTGGGAVYSVTK